MPRPWTYTRPHFGSTFYTFCGMRWVASVCHGNKTAHSSGVAETRTSVSPWLQPAVDTQRSSAENSVFIRLRNKLRERKGSVTKGLQRIPAVSDQGLAAHASTESRKNHPGNTPLGRNELSFARNVRALDQVVRCKSRGTLQRVHCSTPPRHKGRMSKRREGT
jgi:hypothetical protein